MPKPKTLFVDLAPDKVQKSFHIGKDIWDRYEQLRECAKEKGLKLVEPSVICESAFDDAVRNGYRELEARSARKQH